MSHILFITPYYPPDKGAAHVRISETAKRLVRDGHQVSVLTTVPNYPAGVVPPEYRGHIIQEEMRDGVRVVRAWSVVAPNTTFLRRVIPQLFFAFLVPFLGARAVGRPDVIIVQSPPLINVIAGRLMAVWKRRPFIFWVADLWPETPIQMGVLRNPLLIRLSRWLEWSTYQRAGLVWVVADGVRDNLIQRGFPKERIFLCINGVDTTMFRPLSQAQARAELGWGSRFTVLYAGTHGVVHGLKTVIDAAEQLRGREEIQFKFVGDGAQKADLMALARERGLKNVTFLDAYAHGQMPLVFAAADICLIPARKAEVLRGFLPAKLFEIMACGRPILLGIDGEARWRAEEEAGAALYVEPENPEALALAVLHLYEHPELAGALGKNGRAYAEANFERDRLIKILEDHLAGLLGGKGLESAQEFPALSGSVGGVSQKY